MKLDIGSFNKREVFTTVSEVPRLVATFVTEKGAAKMTAIVNQHADLLALRDAVGDLVKSKDSFDMMQNRAALVAAYEKVK